MQLHPADVSMSLGACPGLVYDCVCLSGRLQGSACLPGGFLVVYSESGAVLQRPCGVSAALIAFHEEEGLLAWGMGADVGMFGRFGRLWRPSGRSPTQCGFKAVVSEVAPLPAVCKGFLNQHIVQVQGAKCAWIGGRLFLLLRTCMLEEKGW